MPTSERTTLFRAAANGHPIKVEIETRAIDPQNIGGQTRLQVAARNGDQDVVEALLGTGALATVEAPGTTSPIMQAAASGHAPIIHALVMAGVPLPEDPYARSFHTPQTPLHVAASNGHVQAVDVLMASGADHRDRTLDDRSALPMHLAAEGGHSGAIESLAAGGAGHDFQEMGGGYPLHYAGNADSVNALLTMGAMVDAENDRGVTSLQAAAESGLMDSAKALLEYGANPDGGHPGGDIDPAKHHADRLSSPLHLAAEDGSSHLAECLVGTAATLDLEDARFETPLHLAGATGASGVVSVFFQGGVDALKHYDDCEESSSPMQQAVRGGNVRTLEVIAEEGFRGNSEDFHEHFDPVGMTPLHIASANGDHRSVESLLSIGADPNKSESGDPGWNPLHIASGARVARSLVCGGAGPDAVDIEGNSSLHTAVNFKDAPKFIREVINAGADPSIRNQTRLTARQVAAVNRDYGAVAELIRAEASRAQPSRYKRVVGRRRNASIRLRRDLEAMGEISRKRSRSSGVDESVLDAKRARVESLDVASRDEGLSQAHATPAGSDAVSAVSADGAAVELESGPGERHAFGATATAASVSESSGSALPAEVYASVSPVLSPGIASGDRVARDDDVGPPIGSERSVADVASASGSSSRILPDSTAHTDDIGVDGIEPAPSHAATPRPSPRYPVVEVMASAAGHAATLPPPASRSPVGGSRTHAMGR